jgi:hypothetical protein
MFLAGRLAEYGTGSRYCRRLIVTLHPSLSFGSTGTARIVRRAAGPAFPAFSDNAGYCYDGG